MDMFKELMKKYYIKSFKSDTHWKKEKRETENKME
jgi:hypothetical protein